jgi:hypothetical protein
MTLPVLVLGIVLSTFYGAAFHLWRGGGPGRLFLYLILGWIGFWVGHALAAYFNLTLGRMGPLQVLAGTVSSILFLGVGYWLSLVEVERR